MTKVLLYTVYSLTTTTKQNKKKLQPKQLGSNVTFHQISIEGNACWINAHCQS